MCSREIVSSNDMAEGKGYERKEIQLSRKGLARFLGEQGQSCPKLTRRN
jgi:hypothetical protein